MIANAHEILDLIQLELGKSRKHAYEEVLDTAITARYNAHIAAGFLRAAAAPGALPLLTTTREHRRPRASSASSRRGTTPDAEHLRRAGRADGRQRVVIKPDSQTPFSASGPARCSRGRPAGRPRPGGDRQRRRARPAAHRRRRLPHVHRQHGDRAAWLGTPAARLIDCSMELGGKNPPSSSTTRRRPAGRGRSRVVPQRVAFGISTGAGQVCVWTERLYVQDGIYDSFVPRLSEALRGLKLGSSLSFDDDVGSLRHADSSTRCAATSTTRSPRAPASWPVAAPAPTSAPTSSSRPCSRASPRRWTLPRRDLRPRGLRLPLRRRRRGDRGRERLRLRPQRQHLDARRRPANAVRARIEAGRVGINDAYQAAWARRRPMGGFKTSPASAAATAARASSVHRGADGRRRASVRPSIACRCSTTRATRGLGRDDQAAQARPGIK